MTTLKGVLKVIEIAVSVLFIYGLIRLIESFEKQKKKK